jgi:hypothetical protein
VATGSSRESRRAFVTAMLVATALSIFSANPFLSVACVLGFAAIWHGALKSPFRITLATYLSIQWCQVTMLVWLGNIYGVSLAEPQLLSLEPSQTTVSIHATSVKATLYGLAAIAAIAVGFRLVPGASRPISSTEMRFRPAALLGGYLVLLIADIVLLPSLGATTLSQGLFILGDLRMVFASLLVFQWVLKKEAAPLVALIILLEVVIGFGGYFSQFKQIFIVLLLVLLSLAPIAWRRVYPILALVVVAVLALGVVWTAVKADYRTALSEGRREQIVSLTVGNRIATLQDLIGNQSSADLGSSTMILASRIAYTSYLALALQRTPEIQPHTGGALWGAALENVLAPRFLFPGKPPLVPDSDTTARYTGEQVAGAREGTSISMGYAADAYVDFGIFGGLFVSLLLGILYGAMTAFIASRMDQASYFVAVACTVAMLASVAQFEISSVKLLGGIIWAFVGAAAFAKLFWPAARSALLARDATARRPRRAADGPPRPQPSLGEAAALEKPN